MIHTLVPVPCAHCDDIVIKLVIRYPGWCSDERACLWPGFDSRKVLVVPIQQTGFIVFSVFTFSIEVYKKCNSNSYNFGKLKTIERYF